MDLIQANSSYGKKDSWVSTKVDLPIPKELLKNIPPNGKQHDFENIARVDDMLSIQALCKKCKKGLITKESIVKMYDFRYKPEKIEKYIDRCMK